MYSNVIIGSFLSDYVSVNVKKPAQTPVNAESYAGYYCIKADNGIRTHDLPLRRRLLYPTELLALILVGLQVFILATSSSLSKKDLFSSA